MRHGPVIGVAFVVLLVALPALPAALGGHLAPDEPETCYDPPESEVADARGHDSVCVDIVSFEAYDPAVLVVDPGTQVVWYNDGNLAHTVSFVVDSTGANVDTFVPAGGHASHTFEDPGTVYYNCQINAAHTATMHGSVVVAA